MAAAKKRGTPKKTNGKKRRQVATSVGVNGLVEKVLGRAQRDRLLEVAILGIPGLSEQYLRAIFKSLELSAPDEVIDEDERSAAWEDFFDNTARLLSTDENACGEFVRRVSGLLDRATSPHRMALWERLAALWRCERTHDRYAQRNAEDAGGLASQEIARNEVGRRRGSAMQSGPTVAAETETHNQSVRVVWGAAGACASKVDRRRRANDPNVKLQRIADDEREREATKKWRDALSKRLPAKTPTTNEAFRVAIRELRKAIPAARVPIQQLEAEQDTSTRLTLGPRIEIARRVVALAGRGRTALEDHATRELIDALKAERDILSAAESTPHGWGLAGAQAVVQSRQHGARRHPTALGEKAWLFRKTGLSPAKIALRLFPGEAGDTRARVNQLLHRYQRVLERKEKAKKEWKKKAKEEWAAHLRAARTAATGITKKGGAPRAGG